MREKFGNDIYESWIKKIELVEEFHNYILFSVSTRFIRDWIVSRYLDQILQTIKEYKKDLVRIEFTIKNNNETESTVLGPFHAPAPEIKLGDNIAIHVEGEKCFVKGTVKNSEGLTIPGASVDVWQSGPDGLYDVQKGNNVVDLRGKMKTDIDGKFCFRR